MKKIITIMAVMAMCFCFASCTEDTESSSTFVEQAQEEVQMAKQLVVDTYAQDVYASGMAISYEGTYSDGTYKSGDGNTFTNALTEKLGVNFPIDECSFSVSITNGEVSKAVVTQGEYSSQYPKE